MPREISAITVLIASPSDTSDARKVVRDQVFQWSINAGLRRGVVALPWLFEQNAIPMAGGRPQALINEQAVDDADVVVAFFNSRLGTNTGIDISGTVEEIRAAQERDRPVHVYFSEEPRPRNIDFDQAAALERFRAEIQEASILTGSYRSADDLARQVTSALEQDVEKNGWTTKPGVTPQVETGTSLRWHHAKETGLNRRGKTITKRNELVVTNTSPVDAENLVFKLSGAPLDSNGRPAMTFDGPEGPVTVHGESERAWRLVPLRPFEATIEATWTQAGQACKHVRTFPVGR